MSEVLAHRLDGLEPDNLLAFLALLGLLRALDAARPDWRARAYWRTGLALFARCWRWPRRKHGRRWPRLRRRAYVGGGPNLIE